MTRSDAWQWILIAALTVGLFYSWDANWQLERAQAAQLTRLWESELEVTELRTQVQALKDEVSARWGRDSLCME